MGVACVRLSLRARYWYFKWRILTFTGRNWECHVIIVIKTDLSGFVVTMHSGLCEQHVKSLGLTPSGFDFLFRTHPRALWQHPSRTGLNPLSNNRIFGRMTGQLWMHHATKTELHYDKNWINNFTTNIQINHCAKNDLSLTHLINLRSI